MAVPYPALAELVALEYLPVVLVERNPGVAEVDTLLSALMDLERPVVPVALVVAVAVAVTRPLALAVMAAFSSTTDRNTNG